MSSRFVYRGDNRTDEEFDRKANQSGSLYDPYVKPDFRMIKIREGEACLRILPNTWPVEDDAKWGSWWNIECWLHYEVGPDNGTFLCRKQMLGEQCPVCTARADAADEEENYQLKPKLRPLAWVIDRDDEKAGPQPWSIPLTLFREINDRSKDRKTGAKLKIDHHLKGYDIMFNRKGTDKRTKYTGVEVSRDPSPLHDNPKVMDAWLDFVMENPLPSLLVYFPAEHIAEVMSGGKSMRREGGGEERRARFQSDEETAPRERFRRADPTDAVDEPEPQTRQRRAAAEPADQEETPWEGNGKSGTRAAPRREETTEAEADEAPSSAKGARASLDRLRTRRGA